MATDTSITQQEQQAPEGVERTKSRQVFRPRVDIIEAPDHVTLVADMPGVDENHIDITVEKNLLTLQGHVQMEAPEGYRLGYREYNVGDFERRFTLADEIERDNIEASMKDGQLRLKLPKAKESLSRKVEVKSG